MCVDSAFGHKPQASVDISVLSACVVDRESTSPTGIGSFSSLHIGSQKYRSLPGNLIDTVPSALPHVSLACFAIAS